MDRLVQRLEAELRLKRVRYPPGQNLAGEPRNVSTTLRHLGFEFRLGLALFALAG
jgi:hypothetical protein